MKSTAAYTFLRTVSVAKGDGNNENSITHFGSTESVLWTALISRQSCPIDPSIKSRGGFLQVLTFFFSPHQQR
jgi:hypothetical protein